MEATLNTGRLRVLAHREDGLSERLDRFGRALAERRHAAQPSARASAGPCVHSGVFPQQSIQACDRNEDAPADANTRNGAILHRLVSRIAAEPENMSGLFDRARSALGRSSHPV